MKFDVIVLNLLACVLMHSTTCSSVTVNFNLDPDFTNLPINIFCGLRYLKGFIAKDIQSRCRNLRNEGRVQGT